MAAQLLLPSPSKQSLSHEECIALVQIFVNASLACIAHTRELIPWVAPCFRTRYIGQIDPASFTNDKGLYSAFQTLESNRCNTSQEIRVLVRGGHKYADQMLEMLVELAQ